MAEDQGKEEEKFDFTSEGEGYISLDEARVLAIRTASQTPGLRRRRYRDVQMAFQVVSATEDEETYDIVLSYRPQGDFTGTPGQEHFIIGKHGEIILRQVLFTPKELSQLPILRDLIYPGYHVIRQYQTVIKFVGVVLAVIIASIGAIVAMTSSGKPVSSVSSSAVCDASQITNVVVGPSPSYPGSSQLSWNYPDICVGALQAGDYWEQRTEYLPLGDGWHRGGGYGRSTGTNLWGYDHPNYWLVNEGGTDQERACHAVNTTIRINSAYRIGTVTTDYVSGPHPGIISSYPVAVGCPS